MYLYMNRVRLDKLVFVVLEHWDRCDTCTRRHSEFIGYLINEAPDIERGDPTLGVLGVLDYEQKSWGERMTDYARYLDGQKDSVIKLKDALRAILQEANYRDDYPLIRLMAEVSEVLDGLENYFAEKAINWSWGTLPHWKVITPNTGCGNCGKYVDRTYVFCPHCGTKKRTELQAMNPDAVVTE